jgi:hypothetical protein
MIDPAECYAKINPALTQNEPFAFQKSGTGKNPIGSIQCNFSGKNAFRTDEIQRSMVNPPLFLRNPRDLRELASRSDNPAEDLPDRPLFSQEAFILILPVTERNRLVLQPS